MHQTMNLEQLDEAIAQLPSPVTQADFEARTALVSRRIRLQQSMRVAEANSSRHKPRGNLVVNVPAGSVFRIYIAVAVALYARE